ncbi:hypothetical protein ACIBI9_29680 [Nonomuraea sp. NPDC050451]|uniref:hypothetical protein n=1 Tax=Nonomuraea sp. NPDC050451 TaxID=3364364 RepID=UPI0037AE3688
MSKFSLVPGHGLDQADRVRVPGESRIVPVSPLSAISPCRSTMARSVICRTTARSWVMNSMPVPCSRRTSRSSSSTCAWTDTSSAATGSSQISSRGRTAMALAMATRWRSPPDSALGLRAA